MPLGKLDQHKKKVPMLDDIISVEINVCVRALDSAQYVTAGLPLSGHCHLPINSCAAGCSCSKA